MSESPEWIDVQTYPDLESAKEVLALFRENALTYMIVEDKHRDVGAIDMEFANRGIAVFHLQVAPQDFERAERIIALASGQFVQEVEEDDYLSKFSDAELLEILHKPDEWNQTDVQLAYKFLQQRGHQVSPQQMQEFFAERIRNLEKPLEASTPFLILGYLFALLGGVVGLLFGFQLATFTKRLPDGRKVPHYSPQSRKHGKQISALSIPVTLALVFVYLYWIS